VAGLRLVRLKHLWFWAGNHQITNAGLEFLKEMKELEHRNLAGWHVSDEAISNLSELKNLKTV